MGILDKITEIRNNVTASHDEKIMNLAAGRNIFVVENFEADGKGCIKDSCGKILYRIIESSKGKIYHVCDSSRTIDIQIKGNSSEDAYIDFGNDVVYKIKRHTSLKGEYYTVKNRQLVKIAEESQKDRKSIRAFFTSMSEQYIEIDTRWEIQSSLTGSNHKFFLDSELLGETKASYSPFRNVSFYVFSSEIDYVKMLLLLKLSIDTISAYRSEESEKEFKRDYREERKREKKEQDLRIKKNNKKEMKDNKEKTKKSWPLWTDADLKHAMWDYDDDED